MIPPLFGDFSICIMGSPRPWWASGHRGPTYVMPLNIDVGDGVMLRQAEWQLPLEGRCVRLRYTVTWGDDGRAEGSFDYNLDTSAVDGISTPHSHQIVEGRQQELTDRITAGLLESLAL